MFEVEPFKVINKKKTFTHGVRDSAGSAYLKPKIQNYS